MNLSTDNYFELGPEIQLPGIERKMKLPRGFWYRYDSEVADLLENLARTELIMRGYIDVNRSRLQKILDWLPDQAFLSGAKSVFAEKFPHMDQLNAYCFAHQVPARNTRAVVIAKKAGLDKSKSVFADGHESGELLIHMGQKHLMQEFLEEENVDLDSRQYQGEQFADLGGLLALRKAVRSEMKGVLVPEFRYRPAVLKEQREAFGFK
jgi:hypothetical protein